MPKKKREMHLVNKAMSIVGIPKQNNNSLYRVTHLYHLRFCPTCRVVYHNLKECPNCEYTTKNIFKGV